MRVTPENESTNERLKTMDCKQVLEHLSDYVDDDVSGEMRQAIEAHLSRCRRCRVVFHTTNRTLQLVVDAEPFEVPLSVSARLYARLEQVLAEKSGGA